MEPELRSWSCCSWWSSSMWTTASVPGKDRRLHFCRFLSFYYSTRNRWLSCLSHFMWKLQPWLPKHPWAASKGLEESTKVSVSLKDQLLKFSWGMTEHLHLCRQVFPSCTKHWWFVVAIHSCLLPWRELCRRAWHRGQHLHSKYQTRSRDSPYPWRPLEQCRLACHTVQFTIGSCFAPILKLQNHRSWHHLQRSTRCCQAWCLCEALFCC